MRILWSILSIIVFILGIRDMARSHEREAWVGRVKDSLNMISIMVEKKLKQKDSIILSQKMHIERLRAIDYELAWTVDSLFKDMKSARRTK